MIQKNKFSLFLALSFASLVSTASHAQKIIIDIEANEQVGARCEFNVTSVYQKCTGQLSHFPTAHSRDNLDLREMSAESIKDFKQLDVSFVQAPGATTQGVAYIKFLDKEKKSSPAPELSTQQNIDNYLTSVRDVIIEVPIDLSEASKQRRVVNFENPNLLFQVSYRTEK